MTADNLDSSGGAPAVDRAMRILDHLAHVQPEASLSDLAAALRLNKSTCFNILKSLQHAGVVARDSRVPLYRLGPKLVELGTASRRNYSYRVVVARELEPLVDKFDVTCLIAQLLPNDAGMVVTDRIVPELAGALTAPVGQVHPLTVPAMGRAVLATRPFAAVVGLMDVLSIGDGSRLAHLREQLDEVRKRGYALSLEEYRSGVNAVATTVLDADGDISMILCLMGSVAAFPADTVYVAGEDLRQRAQRLEQMLKEATPNYPFAAGVDHAPEPRT